ncbi:MAG: phospho-sugar mutase [Bernardetiaceae bacterium]|nr:phospho-sugar mutase [Bernardetiaceae bacterium]
MTTEQRIHTWLEGAYDEDTKAQIRAYDKTTLEDAFYKELEFGTGGLRGIMGAGSNRVNKYTIGAATQGLSNYLKKQFPNQALRIAIAHDNRLNSRSLAQVVAHVFSANDIEVFLFEDLRPTPELSFAIRTLGCQSGVMLTASHNPKEYNGYKAYWNDGGQIVAPHDKAIIAEVNAIGGIENIKFEANPQRIHSLGEEMDKRYLAQIKSLIVNPKVIQSQSDLKIVYSPLHGAGAMLVPRALSEAGFNKVHVVEEQAVPDGNFSTLIYPNPEEKEAMTLALRKAESIDADLVMANDPDADRVGIAVKNEKGDFVLLNGNQTVVLLVAYMLEAWQQAQKLNGKQMIIKTVVTTDLLTDIADNYNVDCFETLTGFKHIAAMIHQKEGKNEFIVGGEESYGYLIGDAVRDKDGVAACVLLAELCAAAKAKGKTLYQQLLETYIKYGFYKEDLYSLTLQGKQGAEKIQQMMQAFRTNPPHRLGGYKVVGIKDYERQLESDFTTEKPFQDFPKSNVLQFMLEGGGKVSVRPSGTEPKIKFYFSLKKTLKNIEDLEKTDAELAQAIEAIKQDLC